MDSESTRYPRYREQGPRNREQGPRNREQGPVGLKGFLIVALVWLSLTLFGSWLLLGWTGILYEGLPETRNPASDLYNPIWAPLLAFDFTASAVLFIGSILGIIFISTKRRLARPYMVAFSSFATVVAVVNLASAVGFEIASLRDAGYWDYADAVVVAQVFNMVGAAWGAAFIPYFLVSKRVKNTMINPQPGLAAASHAPDGMDLARSVVSPSGLVGTANQAAAAQPAGGSAHPAGSANPAGSAHPAGGSTRPARRSRDTGRYCVICGKYEPHQATFCTACGAKLPSFTQK